MNRAYLYGNSYRLGYSLPKTSQMPEKWPEDIQCVHPSKHPHKGAIYVSNVEAASNHLTLSKLNIKAVMTCARGHDRNIPKSKLDMFQYFPFEDRQSCDLSPYFERACNFIAHASQKTNVLVHCIAGVSRSVSMVLAYLIRDKGMTYDQAYHSVKLRRKIINPNQGFIKQLKEYANKIKQKNSSSKKIQLTPKKQNYTEKQRDRFSTTYRSATGQKLHKWKNIHNQQDNDIYQCQPNMYRSTSIIPHPKQQKQYKISMTPHAHKKDYRDFNDIKKSTLVVVPKSSPLIEDEQTPQKQKKQINYSTYQKINLYSTNQTGNTNYFKQMSKQLNDKIDVIHAKYQKKREELIARRGYSSGYTRDNNKNNDRQYQFKNVTSSESYKDKLGKSKNFGSSLRQSSKYNGLFDSTYSKGTRYTDMGGFTSSNYYKNKYY